MLNYTFLMLCIVMANRSVVIGFLLNHPPPAPLLMMRRDNMADMRAYNQML